MRKDIKVSPEDEDILTEQKRREEAEQADRADLEALDELEN